MSLKRAWLIATVLFSIGCGGGGSAPGGGGLVVQTLIAGASFPSDLEFAPDGRLFFTEKNTGQVRVFENGTLLPTPFATLPVGTTGEQGLLGLCFDPNFASNHYVYVFYSRDTVATQRIARFTDSGNIGTNFTVLVDDIPRGSTHCGGKLAFGADGKLYATVGETGDASLAQNTGSLAGKVLRFNPDGTIPSDNPIPGNALYTLGHRNCFGLAKHPTSGTMYVSENGPNFDDELNRLTPGANYGWRPGQPQGDTDPNYVQPIRRYSSIVAPAGICFYQSSAIPGLSGHLLMACFVEGTIRSLAIDDSAPGTVTSESVLISGVDRPTDVAFDGAGSLYISTPNSILRATFAP